MKAMIFAAGIGSRLKPWTDHHPKALVPVGGVPMLERVITNLRDADIKEIVINVHHFADQIEEFLSANANFGVNIAVSDERTLLLDTGGGLLKASPLLDGNEPVILHNADILTDVDIKAMHNKFIQEDADAMLLMSNRQSSRCLYYDEAGRMRGWGNISTGETKPADLNTNGLVPLAFGGVHIINPKSVLPVLRSYAPGDVFSITDFYIAACDRLSIKSYNPGEIRWYDVGKPASLQAAEATMHH